MAHSVNIAGEVHEIGAGKCNIAGESHEIKCGHANISGERCDIKFGVMWRKWSCERVVDSYKEKTEYDEQYMSNGGYTFYESYTKSSSTGTYTLKNSVRVSFATEESASEAVGLYFAWDPRHISEVLSLDLVFGDGEWAKYQIKNYYFEEICTYSKGIDDYGVVVAPENSVKPEDGEHIKGGLNFGYCVLLIDDVYYYYELV